MPKPVTESLVVHWRPTVQYHLHRLDLLALAKESGSLEQFLVTPERIGVRTDSAQMTMDDGEVSLYARGSLLASGSLDLLRLAFGCASPPEYHYFVAFQFLMPITEQSYDEARRSALDRLSLGSLNAYDFALIMDGRAVDTEWHCEFGVISEGEVEERLRRRVGRTGKEVGTLPLYVPVPTDITPVSVFADLLWQVSPRSGRGIESVDDLAEHIRVLRDEAEQIVARIHAEICDSSSRTLTRGDIHE